MTEMQMSHEELEAKREAAYIDAERRHARAANGTGKPQMVQNEFYYSCGPEVWEMWQKHLALIEGAEGDWMGTDDNRCEWCRRVDNPISTCGGEGCRNGIADDDATGVSEPGSSTQNEQRAAMLAEKERRLHLLDILTQYVNDRVHDTYDRDDDFAGQALDAIEELYQFILKEG
jgi:hypothetical protein